MRHAVPTLVAMTSSEPQRPAPFPTNPVAQPRPTPRPADFGPHGALPVPLGPGGQLSQPGMPIIMATPKSPGIAVLLSFLFLGAGHLYANRIGPGVALIVYEVFLGILSATVVGLVVSVPLWLISVPIVMILAANAAGDYNRRNGLVVR